MGVFVFVHGLEVRTGAIVPFLDQIFGINEE